jgi:hypothetical protein
LQTALDDFLTNALNIQEYDRLYLPGGPGALATSGLEFNRSERISRELRFLVEAHQIDELILIFHGPASDGPVESLCADYVRSLSHTQREKIVVEQEKDAVEVASPYLELGKVHVRAYQCEVTADLSVQFRKKSLDPHKARVRTSDVGQRPVKSRQ